MSLKYKKIGIKFIFTSKVLHQKKPAHIQFRIKKSFIFSQRARSRPLHRKEFFDKQQGICHYCKKVTVYDKWTLDHLIPVSRGGANALSNKIGCCQKCNQLKGCLTEPEFFNLNLSPSKSQIKQHRKKLSKVNEDQFEYQKWLLVRSSW